MFDTSDVRAAQLQHLADLGDECTPVFWQSWFVYPHTGLAELHSGSWDFKSITPLLQDMLGALGSNRELSLQFGTIPQWMLSGAAGAAGRAEAFPADPAQLVWGEEQPCTHHSHSGCCCHGTAATIPLCTVAPLCRRCQH